MAVKKGYKQTAEHIAKRIRRGAEHHLWKGDAIADRSGRTRAERLYPEKKSCSSCANVNAERHHRDGNTANNEPSNIVYLCRRCHMKTDGRIPALLKAAEKSRAKSVEAAAVEKRSRTTCKRGHLLSGDNLYLYGGKRHCKECRRMHSNNRGK